jgi:NADPH-dependent 2,4-dienoyl-CoA reductase/sulfur reductase-like enzyme
MRMKQDMSATGRREQSDGEIPHHRRCRGRRHGCRTAAARLRRLDEAAEIVLLERGEYISYANCGLPYYAGGVIKERSKLFVMTPSTTPASSPKISAKD